MVPPAESSDDSDVTKPSSSATTRKLQHIQQLAEERQKRNSHEKKIKIKMLEEEIQKRTRTVERLKK